MEQLEHVFPLGFFLGIYVLVCIGLIIYQKKVNVSHTIKTSKSTIFIALGVVLLCTFIFKCFISLSGEGFPADIACFKSWAKDSFNNLIHFYRQDAFCDYPPFYIFVLWVCGALMKIGIPEILAIKLPTILAETAIAFLVFKTCKDRYGTVETFIFVALAALNPLNILDTAIWGQMDAFLTCAIILYLLAVLDKKYIRATLLLALAILIKPQALFFSPILLFAVIKEKSLLTFLKCVGSGLLEIWLVICLFEKSKYLTGVTGFLNLPIIRDFYWLFSLYLGTAEGYDYASLNAANFYSMIGKNLAKDSDPFLGTSFAIFGIALVAFVIILAAVFYFKSKKESHVWLVSAFLISGIFCFATRMHERYMVPVALVLFFAWLYNKDWKTGLLTILFTVTNYLNVEHVLVKQLVENYPHIHNDSALFTATSIMNCVGFVGIALVLIYEIFVLGGKKKNAIK